MKVTDWKMRRTVQFDFDARNTGLNYGHARAQCCVLVCSRRMNIKFNSTSPCVRPCLRVCSSQAEGISGKKNSSWGMVVAAEAGSLHARENALQNASKSKSSNKRGKVGKNLKMGESEKESLELLEWSSVCHQVACFCRTAMAAQRAVRGLLPIGRNLEESRALYSQAKEASEIIEVFDFEGIYDLRRAMEAAENGQALHPLVLAGVHRTLTKAVELREKLKLFGDKTASLQYVARGIESGIPSLRHSISSCVNLVEGRLVDEASSCLKEIRSRRRSNREHLHRIADEWSRKLCSLGMAERAQVVIRRDRLCIPIKAGRQSELPVGSVVLATSSSKSTVYMEPAEMIPLNNTEAALSAEQSEEEERILLEISSHFARNAGPIRRLLRAVENLDLAAARARHGNWVHGIIPNLQDISSKGPDINALVHLQSVLHPLLLERTLPELPCPPLPEVPMTTLAQDGPMAAVNLIPELWQEIVPPSDVEVHTKKQALAKEQNEDQPKTRAPVPIDIVVPNGTSVVAVTGPNTGGKTVSLKTLGLMSLMAKAGILIPVSNRIQQMDAEGKTKFILGDDKTQFIGWFDRVLADIGDGQNLQQNLSTFSGHVKRLQRILKEATTSSLVLLDELGSGTDPGEGAALAIALLVHFSEKSALTFATSHHAEVKEVAFAHPKFVNASVEFDLDSLQPTYKLCWGTAGESNALNIGTRLGFDFEIIQDAKAVLQELRRTYLKGDDTAPSLKAVAGVAHSDVMQKSLEYQLEQASNESKILSDRRKEREAEILRLESDLRTASDQVRNTQENLEKTAFIIADIEKNIDKIVADYLEGRTSFTVAEEKLKILRETHLGHSEDSQVNTEVVRNHLTNSTDDRNGLWRPAIGDQVCITKMGNAVAEVLSINRKSEKITVRAGALTLELPIIDVVPPQRKSKSVPTTGYVQKIASPKAVDLKAAKRRLRAGSSKAASKMVSPDVISGIAVQTNQNKITLLGLTVDEAIAELEYNLNKATPGSVLFAVHGVGTGRVRQAVMDVLQKKKAGGIVEKWEEAEGSNGGCTMICIARGT